MIRHITHRLETLQNIQHTPFQRSQCSRFGNLVSDSTSTALESLVKELQRTDTISEQMASRRRQLRRTLNSVRGDEDDDLL